MAKLSSPFCGLTGDFSKGLTQLFVAVGQRFLETVEIIDYLIRNLACQRFEVQFRTQTHLDLCLNHLCELVCEL